MEGILHYIWSKGILPESGLKTTGGKALHITNPGKSSTETPKFFKDAEIDIDGVTHHGCVILHGCTEDAQPPLFFSTEKEQHTILHVSLNGAYIPSGNDTDLLAITCPNELIEEFNSAQKRTGKFPCHKTIAGLPKTRRQDILSGLLTERLEEKRRTVERIFMQCDRRWDDTLLKTAIRSFGFGIQGEVFEKWAHMLNTLALGKHSDNLTQIEAIFFGQAGLLDDESIPYYYRSEATQNSYYNELKREYKFLSNKFGLESLDYRMWGGSNSTPHLRIARLAMIYYQKRFTISGITTAQTLTEIYRLLSHPLNGYWQNHVCFGGTETCGNGCMKLKQVDVVIINSVVPLLYIYGKHRKEERLCEKAMNLLQQMEGEENSIIKRWREQGVKADCAADSQALLYLQRNYCRVANCIDCCFAIHYIKERLC